MTREMVHYVVYYNTSDYPDKYVVRRWTLKEGGTVPDAEPLAVVDSLEEARAAVSPEVGVGMCLQRSPDDDIVIQEVWL